MKRQEKRRKDNESHWVKCVCEVLKGGTIAGALTVLLLLLWAFLISGGMMRERWMEAAVLGSCVAGSALGGIYAKRRIKAGRWAVGICVGCVLYLILLTAGVVAYGAVSLERGGGRVLLACLVGGVLVTGFGKRRGKVSRRSGRV